MLEQVGIPDAHDRIRDYPHQFSGGMQQRIMIAMALTSAPALLVADEATSALDVTLEAQILDLLREMRQTYETAILFISHDLGVIAQLCDRVIIMYAGNVVEQGNVHDIFATPQHPYTQSLLASVPSRKLYADRLATIPGLVPSLGALPSGCKFADRCAYVQAVCRQIEPRDFKAANQIVRCHRVDPDADPASGYQAESTIFSVQEALNINAPISEIGDSQPAQPLVQLRNISTYFTEQQSILDRLRGRPQAAVQAVDDVSLDIRRGEIIGLVGESGSGKTTLGKAILQLAPLTRGQIIYNGQDFSQMGQAKLRGLRSRMQMIFQNPQAGLSPRLRVSYLLTEPYKIHNTPQADRYSVAELLQMVGLSMEQADKYPHELSGGQAQRVGIARALALRPEFLVADEPTSGLDVSVAASIVNLMKDLARELSLTYLLITHNLNLVGYVADRIAVMYLGKLVEIGSPDQIFETPTHPYTIGLLSAISEPDPSLRKSTDRLWLTGEIPSPKNPPPGCRFHTRCPFVEERCRREVPALEVIEGGHSVACHLWEKVRG